MNKVDFRLPRLSLALLLAATTVGAALYFYSLSLKEEALRTLQKQQSLWNAAHVRHLASGDEKALITRFLSPYRQLEKRGFIGEERRVEWIDRLRNIAVIHHLFPIDYTIGIREDLSPGKWEIAPFKLRRSVMKLHLPLLHEEDVLALLDGLPKEMLPPFMLRACDLVAVPSDNRHLDASCEIDWYTLAGA